MPQTKGWKTSEFAVGVCSALLVFINHKFNLGIDPDTMNKILVPAALYIVSRGLAKIGPVVAA